MNELIVIVLWESKLFHIDLNVFDNLNKLRYVLLSPIPCANQDIRNSTKKVQEIIKDVKSNC